MKDFDEWLLLVHPLVQEAPLYLQIYYYTFFRDKVSMAEEEPYTGELWEADPNCRHEVVDAPGGGVKCLRCNGWFCF